MQNWFQNLQSQYKVLSQIRSCEMLHYSGDLNPTIQNPETFEIMTFWKLDFKWSSFQKGQAIPLAMVATIQKPDHLDYGRFSLHFKQSLTKWQLFVQISNGWASGFQIHLKSELSEDQLHFKQCLKNGGHLYIFQMVRLLDFRYHLKTRLFANQPLLIIKIQTTPCFRSSMYFSKYSEFWTQPTDGGKINFKICYVNIA